MKTLYRASITGKIIPVDVTRYNQRSLWIGEGTCGNDRLVRFTKSHGFFETLEEASMWSAAKLAKEIEARESDIERLKVRYSRLTDYTKTIN